MCILFTEYWWYIEIIEEKMNKSNSTLSIPSPGGIHQTEKPMKGRGKGKRLSRGDIAICGSFFFFFFHLADSVVTPHDNFKNTC